MSQDFSSSVNSEARVTNEFLGIFTDEKENEWECPYSESYPIIVPQNEDDYFSDNALMNMFEDAPLIQQIRSQENSQKEQQVCNTKQVAINSHGTKSEQFMSEPHSASTNTKSTLTYVNNFSQEQRSPTPPEIFGHSQQLNYQLSSPLNKNNCKFFASGNFCGVNCHCQGCLNTPDSRNTIKRNNMVSGNPWEFASSNNFNVDYSQDQSWPTPEIYSNSQQLNYQLSSPINKSSYKFFASGNFCGVNCHCQGCLNTPDSRNTIKRNNIESGNPWEFASSNNFNVDYSQDQIWPTPEIYSNSQQLNYQISSHTNKRQKTSSVNQFNCTIRSNVVPCLNPWEFASSNNLNVNQGTSSSVNPKGGCKCIKTSCLKGYCPCFKAKVGCSSKTCECQECKNSYGRRNGSDRQLPNSTVVRMQNQRVIFHEFPVTTDPSKFCPSPCSSVRPTQRASFHESPQATPLRFHPRPYPSVQPSELWKTP